MKFEFSRQIFKKLSNIKFHDNPSIGSQVVTYGRRDITKLIAAFRNFENAPKNATAVNAVCHRLVSLDIISVYGRIVLKRIFRKLYARAWTGLISVRIGKNGGLL